MLDSYEHTVWLISVGCQVVLLVRLWRFGMISRYKWFALLLAIHVIEAGALLPFDKFSDAYAYVYICSAILIAVASVLAILELYGMVLNDYSGISSVSRWVISGGFGIAVLISIASLSPDLSNSADKYPLLLYLAVFQRGVYSALLVLMLIISAFIAWFPIPLSRNTIRHTILFAVVFSSMALLLLVRNTFGYDGSPYRLLSAIEGTVHVLCLFGWIFLLRREGQDKTVVVGRMGRQEQSGRLIGQLDAINSSLLKTARK